MAPRGLLGRSRLKNYFPDSGAGVSDAFVRRKSTGKRIFHAHDLPALFAGFPLGRRGDDAASLLPKRRVGRLEFLDVAYRAVFLDYERQHDTSSDPLFESFGRVLHVFLDPCPEVAEVAVRDDGIVGREEGIVSVTRNASSFSGVPFLIAMAFAAVCSASSALPLLSDVAGSISAPLSVMTITPLRAFFAVECGGGLVLEDTHALDPVGIEFADLLRFDSVDDIERFVRCGRCYGRLPGVSDVPAVAACMSNMNI